MYIFDAIRTPRGAVRADGGLVGVKAANLLAQTLNTMKARHDLPQDPASLIAGCVTQTGEQGGHIARMAVLLSDLDNKTPAQSINNFCCSGLNAVEIAALQAQMHDQLTLAGGVESMSRVAAFSDNGPYYSDQTTMLQTHFVPLWFAADFIATLEGITRAEVDAYAAQSQERVVTAEQAARPASLIPIQTKDGLFTADENPRAGVTPEKLAGMQTMAEKLGPIIADQAFLAAYTSHESVDHVHSFGSAPALADAAALVLLGLTRCWRESRFEAPRKNPHSRQCG